MTIILIICMYEVRNDDWIYLNFISILTIIGLNTFLIIHTLIIGILDFRYFIRFIFI